MRRGENKLSLGRLYPTSVSTVIDPTLTSGSGKGALKACNFPRNLDHYGTQAIPVTGSPFTYRADAVYPLKGAPVKRLRFLVDCVLHPQSM